MITADAGRRRSVLDDVQSILAREAPPEDRDLLLSLAPFVYSDMPDAMALVLSPDAVAARIREYFRFVVRTMPPAHQLYRGLPGIHVVGETGSTLLAFTDDGGPDDPDIRVVADEMVVRGWLLGVQPGHGGPPTAHICLMPVHEPQTDVFLADLAASVEAARTMGRVEVDPGLLAMAASLDPSSLPPGAIDMVLAAAGVSLGGDAGGEGIPDRRATLNAIMDLAPEPLVEWLLIEVLGNVLRPSAQ